MARDRRPVTVEVEWAPGVWADVTAQLDGIDAAHGGQRRGNPDRPQIAAASGRLVLRDGTGRPDDRFACRVRFGGATLWQGLVAQPELDRGAVSRTTWSIESANAQRIRTQRSIATAARTVAATLADSALWTRLLGGAPEVSGLPARSLAAIDYAGPVGGWLSRLALVASATVVERRDGRVKLTNPHAAVAPETPVELASGELLISDVRSADRADRIRNTATLTVGHAMSMSETVTRSLETVHRNYGGGARLDAASAVDVAWQASYGVPDDGTYSGWAVAGVEMFALYATGWGDLASSTVAGPTSPNRWRASLWVAIDAGTIVEGAWALPAGYTAELGTPTAAAVPVTLTLPRTLPAGDTQPPARNTGGWGGGDNWQPLVLSWLEIDARVLSRGDPFASQPLRSGGLSVNLPGVGSAVRIPDAGTDDYAVYWAPSASAVSYTSGQHGAGGQPGTLHRSAFVSDLRAVRGLRAVVTLSAERSVSTSTLRVLTATDSASVARWGERPLELPGWLTGQPDVQAQIDSLAELRREHTVRLPIRQPTAALSDRVAGIDAGDWIHLQASDPVRDVDVNAICVVVGRRLIVAPGIDPTVELRCLETPAVPPAPPPPPEAPSAVRSLTATPGATRIVLAWQAPASGAVPVRYIAEWRAGSSGAWTSQAAGTALTATITGLTGSTDYQVRVRATNTVGGGPWTQLSVTTTAPAVAPGIPTALTVTADGLGFAASWTAPAVGTAPIHYDLRHRLSPAGDWTQIDDLDTTSRDVSGLAASTTYDVQVRAGNAEGDSAWTAAVQVTTPASALPAPTLTLSSFVGSRFAILRCSAPAVAGRPIRDRTLEVRAGSSGAWTTTDRVSGAAGQMVARDLVAATAYEFRAYARYTQPAEQSPYSAIVEATSPARSVAPGTPYLRYLVAADRLLLLDDDPMATRET